MNQAVIQLLGQIASNVVLPVLIALVTYLLVDRLGDSKLRQQQSRLGSAILASLEEEVNTGIQYLMAIKAAIEDKSVRQPPLQLMPRKSWSGMETITNEVLLRLIEVSENQPVEGFPLSQARIHCKNYFEHIVGNYNDALNEAAAKSAQGMDWRPPLASFVSDDPAGNLSAAEKVRLMLRSGQKLLSENARRWWPK